MNFLDAMGTSSSGMAAQRFRMNIISSNLANSQTTRTPEGGPYRRRDVIFGALPAPRTFEEELRQQVKGDEPLHAKVLGVTHPETGKAMRFEAGLPKDLCLLLDYLKRL